MFKFKLIYDHSFYIFISKMRFFQEIHGTSELINWRWFIPLSRKISNYQSCTLSLLNCVEVTILKELEQRGIKSAAVLAYTFVCSDEEVQTRIKRSNVNQQIAALKMLLLHLTRRRQSNIILRIIAEYPFVVPAPLLNTAQRYDNKKRKIPAKPRSEPVGCRSRRPHSSGFNNAPRLNQASSSAAHATTYCSAGTNVHMRPTLETVTRQSPTQQPICGVLKSPKQRRR